MTDERRKIKVVTRRFKTSVSQLKLASVTKVVSHPALSLEIDANSKFENKEMFDSDVNAGAELEQDDFNHPWEKGLTEVGTPDELLAKLETVGYFAEEFIVSQLSLLLTTPHEALRTLLLEGPSGCGKSFLAKSLAKITGAELMCLSCFRGMNLQHLIEYPSAYGMAKAISAAAGSGNANGIMNLGIISRAFEASQHRPVILLVDELDKTEPAIDTFFLGPIQDAKVWLESQPAIPANVDNLLLIFTKNFDRSLNEALLRRVQPMRMQYLDSTLERKVLEPYCDPKLIENLVRVADIMRFSDGSYPFERPPAPEELLKVGKYVSRLLDWGKTDLPFIGRSVWFMISKSEHDRQILDKLLRYHPDFFDPLCPDGRKATQDQVYARLARVVLDGLIVDPDKNKREKAYKPEQIGLTTVGTPEEVARKLKAVNYECLPFLATQISLMLSAPSDKVRTFMLEGPSGCGKSYLAKSLAKITGAELMCLSCYKDMNINHLIEFPSQLEIAKVQSGATEAAKDRLLNLGILSNAFLKSQNHPVILLVDEIDKVDIAIDTFFLGPIQDARIWLESRPPIDAVVDNLMIIFTKNYVRTLNDALLRRVHPIRMTYLNANLERNILSKHAFPQLVANLVGIADTMRESNGSYQFDRPPAPEELLTAAHYIMLLLDWESIDFNWHGKNVWAMLAKSEHDRAVLEHMLRFHPDYFDPLEPDGKHLTIDQVYAKLGRIILRDIIEDPERLNRDKAWEEMEYS
jgi:MoxR-like ATPase